MFNLSGGEVSSWSCRSEGYEVTALDEMSLSSAFFCENQSEMVF